MKSIILGCMSLLSAYTVSARTAQKDLPLEQRSTQLPTRVVADDEFLKSWQRGMVVKSISEFTIDGHFAVTDDGELKLWDKWKKWGKRKFDAMFVGIAEAETSCVDSRKGDLVKLWRTYGEVAITRTSAEATYIPNAKRIQKFTKVFFAGKLADYATRFASEARRFAKGLWTFGKASSKVAGMLAPAPEPTPYTKAAAAAAVSVGTGAIVTSKGLDYVADKIDDAKPVLQSANEMWVEHLKDEKVTEKDGGIVFDADSPYLKNSEDLKEFRKLKNLALQVTSNLTHQAFYITASPSKDAQVICLTDNLVNEKNAELAKITQSDDVKTKQELLKKFEKKYYEMSSSSQARDLIERETFTLSAIYAGEPRKLGEEWWIGAKQFDSYLHPELKGNFDGRIYLKYVGDETVEINSAGKIKKYNNARRIELLNESSDHDKSTMKYSEGNGRFEAKYNENSDARLWVDCDSGQVIKLQMNFKSDMEVLPKMLLTEGMKADGELGLNISYQAVVGVE